MKHKILRSIVYNKNLGEIYQRQYTWVEAPEGEDPELTQEQIDELDRTDGWLWEEAVF